MRDSERFARQAFEEVAGDRLARREADRMNEAVEFGPALAQLRKCALDLRVFRDIEVEQQIRVEFGREGGDPLVEPLALVAEGEFGAFAPARE